MSRFYVLIVSVFVSLSVSAASECKLAKNQTLKIGCTSNCDPLIKSSLRKVAKGRGYSLKIIDMYG